MKDLRLSILHNIQTKNKKQVFQKLSSSSSRIDLYISFNGRVILLLLFFIISINKVSHLLKLETYNYLVWCQKNNSSSIVNLIFGICQEFWARVQWNIKWYLKRLACSWKSDISSPLKTSDVMKPFYYKFFNVDRYVLSEFLGYFSTNLSNILSFEHIIFHVRDSYFAFLGVIK